MSEILFYKRPEEYKILVTTEMKKLEVFFKKEFDLDLYLIYGTLLGAIREKDFIGHDYDVDLAYVSKFHSRDKINKEFLQICKVLAKKKLLMDKKGINQFHCKSLTGKIKFDIWNSYKITNLKFYLSPVSFLINSNYVLPLKTLIFRETIFNVPNMPIELMNLLYKNWETPISADFRKFKLKE